MLNELADRSASHEALKSPRAAWWRQRSSRAWASSYGGGP